MVSLTEVTFRFSRRLNGIGAMAVFKANVDEEAKERDEAVRKGPSWLGFCCSWPVYWKSCGRSR